MDIYQLKITLKHIKPPIWRRVEVPSKISLEDLHRIIQVVMPWMGGHLYQFIQNNLYYTTKMDKDAGMESDGLVHKIKLTDALPKEKSKITYEYDFGDGWEHEVLVEKIFEAEKGVKYPRCTAGKRACPPDDCGGPWGYPQFLEILKDPKHPEHEGMKEWMDLDEDEEWDAEYFDVEETNQSLPKL